MKKLLSLVATTMLAFLWPTTPTPANHPPAKNALQPFFVYEWYFDEDMIHPTGTISTINTELVRLRNIYSGSVFSSSPSLGLTEYEFGFFYYYPAAVIYSNLPYQVNNLDSVATAR